MLAPRFRLMAVIGGTMSGSDSWPEGFLPIDKAFQRACSGYCDCKKAVASLKEVRILGHGFGSEASLIATSHSYDAYDAAEAQVWRLLSEAVTNGALPIFVEEVNIAPRLVDVNADDWSDGALVPGLGISRYDSDGRVRLFRTSDFDKWKKALPVVKGSQGPKTNKRKKAEEALREDIESRRLSLNDLKSEPEKRFVLRYAHIGGRSTIREARALLLKEPDDTPSLARNHSGTCATESNERSDAPAREVASSSQERRRAKYGTYLQWREAENAANRCVTKEDYEALEVDDPHLASRGE
jgi:hypothetical protein